MKRILVVLSCAICAVSSAENLRDTLITRLNNADFGLVECIAGIERIEDEVDDATDTIHLLATSHSGNAKRARSTLGQALTTFTDATDSAIEEARDDSILLVAAFEVFSRQCHINLDYLQEAMKLNKLLEDNVEVSNAANAQILQTIRTLNL